MPKRGRLSREEMDYIRLHAHTNKSPAEIGAAIDRSEDVVVKYITDHVPPAKGVTTADVAEAEKVAVRQELRKSAAWKALKEEFFTDELLFFEETYVRMMAQLGPDTLATEDTQVFHAGKYEVLMSRNLKKRKRALEDIERLEDMQKSFLHQFGGDVSAMSDTDKAFALDLETQLNSARALEKDLTNELTKLQAQHADLMKSLKGTRDQRIKQIDSENKNGFLPVLRMLEKRDEAERQGRQIELVKLAGRNEYVRLGRPRTYDDGSDDNPILSADTVDLGREGEDAVESEDE